MKFGRYEVIRELGKGAMGVVYLAKDPLIGRLVALKTIRPAASTDDDEANEFQQRFMREAQAAGILSHPSIVTVHDIGQDADTGVSFIAMEYVEGQNLKEIISQAVPLKFGESAEIIAQIADALDFAHSKGIVHRDVKPANIMLCGDAKAKITDFGIAKIASISANLTTTGQFLGTPNYMAPEQIKGTRVDGRTDIFSLGIVFYECLVRRKPFGGDSLTSISYRIVHEDFAPLSDIDPTLPESFDAIVRKCLAKDPAQRYQRARDLAADIRAALQGSLAPKGPAAANLDQTVFTVDADKTPTVEIPFPDVPESALEPEPELPPSAEISPRRFGSRGPVPDRPQPSAKMPFDFAPIVSSLKRPVSTPLFLGVIAALLIPLLVAIVAIERHMVPVGKVDLKKEALVARQGALRTEADVLLRQGNVEGAYRKYQELRQIAPNSPSIRNILTRLDQIRVDQLTNQQRMSQAKATYEKGLKLYDAKDYAGAIPLFEEAFHLNPAMTEAVNFLRMSREQLELGGVNSTATGGGSTRAARRGASGTTSSPATSSALASLVTMFESPVNNGYVLVKANGESLVYENLWEEQKRGLFRRKIPRTINVEKQVKAGTVDIEVWVVVPSLKMQEHRQLRDQFASGSRRTLTVTLDPEAKKVVVTLS